MFEICGVKFKSESEMFDFIERHLYWLTTHNKNYTHEQYFTIDMIYEMLKDYNYNKFTKEEKKNA